MKLNRTISLFLVAVGLFVAHVPLRANPTRVKKHFANDEFPEPKVDNQLFYLQRDPNINTIVYSLNVKDNLLDEQNPVHAFWIKYAEGSKVEELNYIQRKFAFGITATKTTRDGYDIHIAAYKKYTLHLQKDAMGAYHIYGNINNKLAIMQRVFIRINGGLLFFPNVVYIELKGIDAATGQPLVQRFKP